MIGALIAGAVAASLLGVAGAQAATQRTASIDPIDESNDFRFPGADTMILRNGSNRYITYGASAAGHKVPYTVSGYGQTPRSSSRINGDAWDGVRFPNNYWAKKRSGIWSPGAFTHVKSGVRYYYLFYTAVKAGTTNKHCVGVAKSRRPGGPFRPQARPLACPPKEKRWAIDADVFWGPKGAIWMTWRDGQRANGPESAISVVMLKFSDTGHVRRRTTAQVIMRSDDLRWPHYRDSGVTVLENPSAIWANGWYLFYSGNSWNTNYYATGIAYCHQKIDVGLCKPMPGPRKAYFAYLGPRDANKLSGPDWCDRRYDTSHYPNWLRVRGLPGNKRGPGAMSIYRARGGKLWTTWNYHSDFNWCKRKSRLGRLVKRGTGSDATFRVRLVD